LAAVGGLGAAALPLTAGSAHAQADGGEFPNYFRWDEPIFPDVTPSFTMKVGHQAPPNVFVSGEHVQAVLMKNIVERSTGGDIHVEIYPANALGRAQDQLEQTRAGIIQA